MGDFYEFEIRLVDGEEVSGFCYQNKSTGWQEVFVEFSESQKIWAQEWTGEVNKMMEQQKETVKGWLL